MSNGCCGMNSNRFTKGMIWVVGIVIGIVFLLILSVVTRGCNTTFRMADKTVFNADAHVYSYEEFHRKFQQYKQYQSQVEEVGTKVSDLETKGITSGQRYDNLVMELDGARNMMNRIAAEYNASSDIGYKGIWKDEGLPKYLGK